MLRSTGKVVASRMLGVAGILIALVGPARADDIEKLLIPVGHAQVVLSDQPVKTVVIAEPKIADAAVGSERTVVVNAKSPGSTSLVVYGEGGRFRVYEIQVFTPNSERQVLLHVRVAEVNDRAKRALGVDFSGSGRPTMPGHNDFLSGGLFTGKISPIGLPSLRVPSATIPSNVGPASTGGVSYSRDDPNMLLQLTWQALEEKGDIRVLASPTLVAKNGEKAAFLAGGEFPVPVASNSGSGSTPTVTIEWKPFGVRLEFTPTVEADGSITLQVAPEVSQLDFSNPLTINGFNVPIVDTRKTSTTVRLNPGENLVIGGLKQTEHERTVRKVPLLGDIPLLNFFFSSTTTSNTVRDLLVVVSPEMLNGGSTKMPVLPTDKPAESK